MQYMLAALPILILLFLMVVLHMGGHLAGPLSLLVCFLIAAAAFGLNLHVFDTALAKGLLLSLYVLLIVWPAMLLYQTMQQSDSIEALALTLKHAIPDTGFLWLIFAWCCSAFLEGIAGFGIPIAIVAPIMVTLGVTPVLAVASVAVGHAWSVTFGDMGVVFQALVGVVKMNPTELVLPASLLLGIACILCGITVALLLKQARLIPYVLLIGILMAVVQAALAYFNFITLSGFLAGLSGILVGFLLKRKRSKLEIQTDLQRKFLAILFVYLALSIILMVVFWPGTIRSYLNTFAWVPQFDAVSTNSGFINQAGSGQILRPFLHPGFWILLITLGTVCYLSA